MAQMGFQTVPRPVIDWSSGEPRIQVGQGDPEGPKGGPLIGTERPGYDKPEQAR